MNKDSSRCQRNRRTAPAGAKPLLGRSLTIHAGIFPGHHRSLVLLVIRCSSSLRPFLCHFQASSQTFPSPFAELGFPRSLELDQGMPLLGLAPSTTNACSRPTPGPLRAYFELSPSQPLPRSAESLPGHLHSLALDPAGVLSASRLGTKARPQTLNPKRLTKPRGASRRASRSLVELRGASRRLAEPLAEQRAEPRAASPGLVGSRGASRSGLPKPRSARLRLAAPPFPSPALPLRPPPPPPRRRPARLVRSTPGAARQPRLAPAHMAPGGLRCTPPSRLARRSQVRRSIALRRKELHCKTLAWKIDEVCSRPAVAPASASGRGSRVLDRAGPFFLAILECRSERRAL